MSGEPLLTVRMRRRTAVGLRYVLPLVATGMEHADDEGETTAMLEQAIEDIDRALPPEFRGGMGSAEEAEKRMDVIDKQREAGVRPPTQQKGASHER